LSRVARHQARADGLPDYLKVGHCSQAFPGEMWGAEAQSVAITRALANDLQAPVPIVTHAKALFQHVDHLVSSHNGRFVPA
jgi:ABC-type molybdate transport system ATPase subunit